MLIFKVRVLFCFGLILAGTLLSGSNDSLIKFSDLVFQNSSEKKAFMKMLMNPPESALPDIFLTPYGTQNVNNESTALFQIDKAVAHLEDKTKDMNVDKKTKYIFNYVQKNFLKRYKLDNSFAEMFYNGNFNCVSGSMIFSIIFTRMGIPFHIKEQPNHVYLVAYPSNQKIMIETTSPGNGYINFNDAFIKKFADYLAETQTISNHELESAGAEEIFNRYFFGRNAIGLAELAAIQYCNFSLYYEYDANEKMAVEQIKKAFFLWPSERNRYLLSQMLKSAIASSDVKNETYQQYLALACRLNKTNKKLVSGEGIRYYFAKLLNEFLVEQPNHEKMEAAFRNIVPAIADSALKTQLSFDYYYELARNAYNHGGKEEIIVKHLKMAYSFNPGQENNRELIYSCMVRTIRKTSGAENLIEILNSYAGDFEYLKTDNAFGSIMANGLLDLAYEKIALGEIKQGTENIVKFEKLQAEMPDAKAAISFIEKAYSSIASYYYKKGQVAQTREWLKRGLKYAPESFGLRSRFSQAR